MTASRFASTATLAPRLLATSAVNSRFSKTATEASILAQCVPAMIEARPVEGATMIDLGAGNCEKAASLFARVRPSRYVAVDVSEAARASFCWSSDSRFAIGFFADCSAFCIAMAKVAPPEIPVKTPSR